MSKMFKKITGLALATVLALSLLSGTFAAGIQQPSFKVAWQTALVDSMYPNSYLLASNKPINTETTTIVVDGQKVTLEKYTFSPGTMLVHQINGELWELGEVYPVGSSDIEKDKIPYDGPEFTISADMAGRTYEVWYSTVASYQIAVETQSQTDQPTAPAANPAPSSEVPAPTAAPAPSSAPAVTVSQSGSKTVDNCYFLNVRSGGGVSYSVIGALKKGDQVSVSETKNGWAKIAFGTEYGWVYEKYLN